MPKTLQLAVVGGLLFASLAGCASFAGPRWPMLSRHEPGTPGWWKSNKRRATFEPGKGYILAGAPGTLDGMGRPIDAPPPETAVAELIPKEDPAGLLPGLDPKTAYGRAKEAVGLGPNQSVAETALRRGYDLYAKKDFGNSAKAFREAAERWPQSTIEQEALFMLGESHFFGDKYIAARDAYDELMEKHPNTPKLDTSIERLWAIAQYWEQYEDYNPDWPLTPNFADKSRPRFDTIGHSIKTYDSIRLNDPTGPRADDALMATAGIYFRRERYADADYHYTLLRQEYPRSEYQFEAHLLGLQSKLRKYQGENYDGQPLDEAKTLVSQLRLQFGSRLSEEERSRLRDTEAQVNQAIALRDYRMAKYYDDTEHYLAAKQYYAEVIRKHPDSELARTARERVEQIAGKPDNPAERLSWLVDMFPESPERTRVARIPELRDSRTQVATQTTTEGVVPASGTTPK